MLYHGQASASKRSGDFPSLLIKIPGTHHDLQGLSQHGPFHPLLPHFLVLCSHVSPLQCSPSNLTSELPQEWFLSQRLSSPRIFPALSFIAFGILFKEHLLREELSAVCLKMTAPPLGGTTYSSCLFIVSPHAVL